MKRLLSLIVRGVSGAVRAMGWRACRFYPSCSQYSCEALEHYGAWKGTWLGLGRLLRCHPLSAGGYDPLEKN